MLVTMTLVKALAGVSFTSLKPKSLAKTVYAVSSLNVVIVLSVPAGASLTELTVMLIVSVSVRAAAPQCLSLLTFTATLPVSKPE